MLQALLANRFKLRLHPDTKEVQGFALVLAKNGPKLKPSVDTDAHGSLLPTSGGPFEWTGQNIGLSVLASSLSGAFQSPVTDKTGLTGRYTFILRYAPQPHRGRHRVVFARDLPSIFEALPDQLGLRLESEKASVRILVIDSVERPTEN